MKKILVIGLIVLTGCKQKADFALPYYNSPDFTPVWLTKSDPGYSGIHTIPAFSFTDQDGHTIDQKLTDGKVYVANFFFTRCNNICPRMTANMAVAADSFINDNRVLFISHSVTPWYDDVNVLKKYAADHHISNPNWHLVTGDKKRIYDIAINGYYAQAEAKFALTQFLHTENFILIDKHRHIRGVYNGTILFEVNNMVEQIRKLEQEE